MKKLHLIVPLIGLCALAFTTPSTFSFLRDGVEKESAGRGKIIGVTLTKGVLEVPQKDGTKQYYITGKTLKEVVEAYENER